MILTVLCLATAAGYATAALPRRGSGRRWSIAPLRALAFAAGIAAVWTALGPPIDPRAHLRFSFHMVQHLLLTMVAPPLLLIGTPLALARRAAPSPIRRAVAAAAHTPPARALLFPAVTWTALPAALWLSHYTGLYEAALEHPAIHVGEHVLYLAAGLLFWFPVVALDPGPWRMPHPLRLLYLFVAAPQNAFLGLSLYQAGRVLYPHYAIVAQAAGRDPLADQQAGAIVMWVLGALLFPVAMLAAAGAWAREDRLAARRADVRLEAAYDRAPGATAVSRSNPRSAQTTMSSPGVNSHHP